MICRRGGLIIQRHSELRDLEAELLNMLCYDVEVEPGLLPVTGEDLERGANQVLLSTTGGMGEEFIRYHCRLVELLAKKKCETYSTTML